MDLVQLLLRTYRDRDGLQGVDRTNLSLKLYFLLVLQSEVAIRSSSTHC